MLIGKYIWWQIFMSTLCIILSTVACCFLNNPSIRMIQWLIQMWNVELIERGGNIFLIPSVGRWKISWHIIRLPKGSCEGEMTWIGSPLPAFCIFFLLGMFCAAVRKPAVSQMKLKHICLFYEETPSHVSTPPPPISEWHDGQRRLVSWETVLAQRACAR